MRIVAGKFKGRSFEAPDGKTTRPTTDRVREALFNLLAHNSEMPEIEGARVIDVFAGSGALGFEAISRGASFCLYVETDSSARGVIRRNIETFQLFGNTRIHRRSATDLGAKPAGLGKPFDIAFLDPPYGRGLVEPALNQLLKGDWLAEEAFAIIETPEDEAPEPDHWELLDTRIYGETRMTILKRMSD